MSGSREILLRPDPLAIVGVGCRVRDAAGPDELWSLLRLGKDTVGPLPTRWWEDVYDPDPFAPGKSVSRFGSFLDEVDGIDWRFFGISPREARSIDPQHRLLLEVAWEAFEDAGMPVAQAAGQKAGVFVGIMLNDYGRLYGRDLSVIDGYTTQNNTFAYAANRISFFYDLRGPSMALDTHCSSSLLAVHQACVSVWTGESDWALAGGVNLVLAPDADVSMSKATALSPTGRVRAWDSKADGYVRGEGAGLVIVKPLARAVSDGDRIYALVLGTATNHTGRGNWIVEPSASAQRDVILSACSVAGIRPEEIDYVELHGTGTRKGDPVEAEALGAVMGARPTDRPCRVGSIKTNLGHLYAAAGVAGLIKTALCIHRRELVPSLHFEDCNPDIDLERLKLHVQTTVEPWPRPDALPTAGVTSIAFGGTNVHAILRGTVASSASAHGETDPQSYVLPLSAKSEAALSALAARYAVWLEGDALPGRTLGDSAYTASARRTHHSVRLGVTGSSPAAIAAKLRGFLRGDREAVATSRARPADTRPRIVFVFPGQGPQWVGMARDLMDTNPAFMRAIETCEALVRENVGWSVIETLFAEAERSRMDDPEVVQPVLFSVEMALAALWRSWGVVPDAVVGHSFGEIAAAVTSGAIALEDGARIVCARGRVTQKRAGMGGVAVVDLPGDAVRAILRRYQNIEVGGENAATSTIVTGDLPELTALLEELKASEVFARRVNAGYASHGRDMETVLDEFAALVGPLDARAAVVPFCSTVHGRFVEGTELGALHWTRNLRDPVRFADAIRSIGCAEASIFLEIAPHPVLAGAIEANLRDTQNLLAVLPSLRRGKPSLSVLDESLARLYAAGCDLDWAGRYPNGRVVSTPTYAWQRERMWLNTGSAERSDGAEQAKQAVHPLLGGPVDGPDPDTLAWEQTVGGPETAYFQDHGLQGIPSLSTSAMVEMIAVAASRTLATEALELVDLELRRAFLLPRTGSYRVQTLLKRGLDGREWAAEVRGHLDTSEAPWRTHATARVRLASSPPHAITFDAPLANRLSRDDAYTELADLGLQYGPTFRGIEWLSREGEGVLACVRMPDGLDTRPYLFHPALRDAAMHVVVLAEACRGHYGVLPVRIARIWIRSRPSTVLRSHARVRQIDGRIHADVRVETVDGSVVEVAEGIELAHLDDAIVASDITSEEASWLYGIEWGELAPREVSEASSIGRNTMPGVWLILADRQGVGAILDKSIRASGGETVVLTLDALSGARRDNGWEQEAVRAITSALPAGGSLAGAAHLWSLDLPDLDGIDPERIDAAMIDSCQSAVRLLRLLEEALPASTSPVWFVTRGAQPWALGPRQIAPLQAPLWGLARATALELPSRWGGLVDLDPAASAVDSAGRLWAWLQEPSEGEDEVIFRRGATFGGRLVRRSAAAQRRSLELRTDASYLVTGGTGGLGLTVAGWLARRGAKHLVLAARTPLPPREAWTTLPQGSPVAGTIDALRAIERLGVTVHVISLDVANQGAVIEYVNDHERNGRPPIRGVFHLAGTVQIEDVLQLDANGLLDALRPKIHGTLALHRWLEDLDVFVLFSSAASVIRSPRLGHYAAGNAFLDAMAHYRRARGQPCIAIDWGLWSDVGFIRQLGDRGPSGMRGMKSISPEAGLRILQHLAESDDVQTLVWPPDWENWAKLYPSFARTSLIADLLHSREAAPDNAARSTIRALLTDAPGADRTSAVRDHVLRAIASQLRIPLEELPLDVPLERLGFDSLQATELQARLDKDLGVRIPVLRLLGFAAAQTIVEEVLGRLENEAPGSTLSNSDGRIRAASPHTEGQALQGRPEGDQAVGRSRR